MKHELGATIKKIRKMRGLTQQQLAKGICTQALISHFEKGETIPSSIVLYKLAERLAVDMKEFFAEFKPSEKIHTSNEHIFYLIRRLVAQFDFAAVEEIVSNELNNHVSYSDEERSFLYWHKGICRWKLENDSEHAMRLYDEALAIIEETNPLAISIKNSRAIIYFNKKEYDLALIEYDSCLSFLHNENTYEPNLYKKIHFGLSRVYSYKGDLDQALATCEKAINRSLQEESLYLLGELLFQKGKVYLQQSDIELAREALQQAKTIFQLEDKINYVAKVERLLLKYEPSDRLSS